MPEITQACVVGYEGASREITRHTYKEVPQLVERVERRDSPTGTYEYRYTIEQHSRIDVTPHSRWVRDHIAILAMPDGSRKRLATGQNLLDIGENIAFVQHHALGLVAYDVLRLKKRVWLTNAYTPKYGKRPLVAAIVAAALAAIAQLDIATVGRIAEVVCAAGYVGTAILHKLRIHMIIRSRHSAVQQLASVPIYDEYVSACAEG